MQITALRIRNTLNIWTAPFYRSHEDPMKHTGVDARPKRHADAERVAASCLQSREKMAVLILLILYPFSLRTGF